MTFLKLSWSSNRSLKSNLSLFGLLKITVSVIPIAIYFLLNVKDGYY
jgi:hypothetical protein